jgi:hypothetical protein
MSQGTIETAKNLYQNWDKLTPEQRSELITSGGISAAMAAGSLTHAVSPMDEHIQATGAEPAAPVVRPTAEIPPAEPIQTAQASGKSSIQDAGSSKARATWDDVLGQREQLATAEQPITQAQAREIPVEAAGREQNAPAPEKATIGWDDLLNQNVPKEATEEPQQRSSLTKISTARQPIAL